VNRGKYGPSRVPTRAAWHTSATPAPWIDAYAATIFVDESGGGGVVTTLHLAVRATLAAT
jgi:hypothetical protein